MQCVYTRGLEQGLPKGYSRVKRMLACNGHCLQHIVKRLKPTRGQVPKKVGGMKKVEEELDKAEKNLESTKG